MDWKIVLFSIIMFMIGTGETIKYYVKVKDGSHTELSKLIFYCCMACSGIWTFFISILWR